MNQKKSVLVVKSLKKSFKKRTVLESVSMQAKTGLVIGLLGPNGAGKTTLFNVICGLLAADSGEVYLDDKRITGMPMHQRAKRGIGYLPQGSSIFTHLSVIDNIRCVLQLQNKTKKAIENKTANLMHEFGLETIKKNLGYQLSGGERRRVEIARALAADPQFILLDEPFAGVDPISIIDTKNIIFNLAKKNIGVVITDHNVRETLSICDHGYILANGGLIASGTPSELVKMEKVKKTYLGETFSL